MGYYKDKEKTEGNYNSRWLAEDRRCRITRFCRGSRLSFTQSVKIGISRIRGKTTILEQLSRKSSIKILPKSRMPILVMNKFGYFLHEYFFI